MGLPKNYYNYFDICKKEEINPNTAKAAIGSHGLEGISKIAKLQPIAHLFRVFPKGERKQYGILKRHYDYWKEHGEPPKVSPGRPREYDRENYKDYRIAAPPFDHILEAGLKKMNHGRLKRITKKDFIWLAIKEAMERRPQFFDWNDGNEE
jgi:hypothetical protein